jgi:hypothetical protein
MVLDEGEIREFHTPDNITTLFNFVELWLDDGEIGEFDTPGNITTLFSFFVELWC